MYSQNHKFRMSVVYRPTTLSNINCNIIRTSHHWLFNIYVNNLNSVDTRKFLNSLDDFGLKQHVVDATHNKGHILDLLITRESNIILMSKLVVKDLLFCDLRGNVSGYHKCICSVLNVLKPEKPKQQLSFRQFPKSWYRESKFQLQ